MKKPSAADDLLALLLWGLDILARPSPHNLLQSFEAWDYQNRLRPQLRHLERVRLLERHGSKRKPTLRLTKHGRSAAWGGIDPLSRWQRPWDGRWRLWLFDLPARNKPLRLRLWRWLRTQRFGYLQMSVWLTPDATAEAHFPLQPLKLTPDSFTVIEGRPLAPDSDADIVASAWDFAAINQRYQSAIEVASAGRELVKERHATAAQLRSWLAMEREEWLKAILQDPLLPQALLPASYLGQKAWKEREAVFSAMIHGKMDY
ncbi:MAG: hypothetical protein DME26_09745 [Verrucomicrobia bacterium]|nr:MAG: hypothetical protein DME26_09745 [Verrucomicrobiota bacterium]